MKKLLVLSDSHGARNAMLEAVRLEKPDLIFHLGDYIRDSEWLREQVGGIPVLGVVGNCDHHAPGPEQIVNDRTTVSILTAKNRPSTAFIPAGAL